MDVTKKGCELQATRARGGANITYVLVGNNLDVLDVPSSLEDLSQDILGDARIQAADIERTLVRLWGGATRERTPAGRRHDLVAAHRRGDGCGNRIVVGRNVKRRRWHVGVRSIAILITRGSCVGLRGRGKLTSGYTSIGHDEEAAVV